MKTFKYRTWGYNKMQTTTKKWKGDVFIRLNGECVICLDTGEWEEGYNVSFDKSPEKIILMQFIGLQDKNGRDIYEGDIIKAEWKHRMDDKEEIMVEQVPPMTPEYFHWFSELEDMNVEVIGNKYENPNLIPNN